MRYRASLARRSASASRRRVMSTNVTTTPSIRLSVVRYGSTRRTYHRPLSLLASRSIGTSLSSTLRASASRSGSANFARRSWTGRPTSDGIRSNRSVTVGVYRRMRNWRSRKRTAMSVLASRLARSLLVPSSSSDLAWSWVLTVTSSSFRLCSSSLPVSSSSLALCNSSLKEATSWLAAFSSSFAVFNSSSAHCNSSRVRWAVAASHAPADDAPTGADSTASAVGWSAKVTR